jgi:hypothetical protein
MSADKMFIVYKPLNCCVEIVLLILQSFDWLAAFHLDLLQAILFIAV